MELTFNGTKINLPAEVCYWGDLLEWLENNRVPTGCCISLVLVNGTRELQFRCPGMLNSSLKDMGSVEIGSAELGEAIRENLSEIQSELALALEITQDIVRQLANKAEAGALVQLIQA